MLFAVATHLPRIEFVKGIPENLERDSYFDVNILLSIFRGRGFFFFCLQTALEISLVIILYLKTKFKTAIERKRVFEALYKILKNVQAPWSRDR